MTQILDTQKQLRTLKLSGISDTLELRLIEAQSNQLSYTQFLTMLLDDEMEIRRERKLRRLIQQAQINAGHTLESFDFHFNPNINAGYIKQLATCDFMNKGENIFLLGPTGTGKTHLTQSLCHQACRKYLSVAYYKFYQLFNDLKITALNNKQERLLDRLCKIELLAIDDFAFRKIDQQEAEYLYTIVDSRYRIKSIIINSNRDISDWMSIFPDPIIANAILDRLAQNAHQITIKGESYRKKMAPKKKKVEYKK
jgi:DNA replication protein DnaC